MTDSQDLMEQLYSAFNRRDIDAALALMTEQVSWPKASEGGRITGKQEIRAYWERQWQEFNPHVEPIKIEGLDPDTVQVTVQQRVEDRAGKLLSDQQVRHTYTMLHGLVASMDVSQDLPAFERSV